MDEYRALTEVFIDKGFDDVAAERIMVTLKENTGLVALYLKLLGPITLCNDALGWVLEQTGEVGVPFHTAITDKPQMAVTTRDDWINRVVVFRSSRVNRDEDELPSDVETWKRQHDV